MSAGSESLISISVSADKRSIACRNEEGTLHAGYNDAAPALDLALRASIKKKRQTALFFNASRRLLAL